MDALLKVIIYCRKKKKYHLKNYKNADYKHIKEDANNHSFNLHRINCIYDSKWRRH